MNKVKELLGRVDWSGLGNKFLSGLMTTLKVLGYVGLGLVPAAAFLLFGGFGILFALLVLGLGGVATLWTIKDEADELRLLTAEADYRAHAAKQYALRLEDDLIQLITIISSYGPKPKEKKSKKKTK